MVETRYMSASTEQIIRVPTWLLRVEDGEDG
jgi:hypothetical protein